MTTISLRNTLWRFAVVGLINTIAGLTFIYIMRALGFGEVSANATGYAIGLVFSFVLNRHWTFRHRGVFLTVVFKFLVVVLLAWLANLAVLVGLMRWGISAVLAQAGAVLPYTLVSYVGFRRWVFENRLNSVED